MNCQTCDSENLFIVDEKVAQCRDCGEKSDFHYGQVPTIEELKALILEGCNNDKAAAGELVKDFFWHKDKSDEAKFSAYFNAHQVQKFGFPFLITGNDDPATWPVLTLHEPFATLFAHGLKLIETRPKPINYIGTILIHAAKDEPKPEDLERFKEFLSGKTFHLGHIIGAYDHSHCAKVVHPDIARTYADDITAGIKMIPPAEPELSFGDYSFALGKQRFGWIGRNHRVLEKPIPYTNGQGYYLKFKGNSNDLIFKR
jgi:hypothetical protein